MKINPNQKAIWEIQRLTMRIGNRQGNTIEDWCDSYEDSRAIMKEYEGTTILKDGERERLEQNIDKLKELIFGVLFGVYQQSREETEETKETRRGVGLP